MDFKRNTRYFSQTFARNLTILSIVGGALAVVCGLVWWYIYLGGFAILVEIAAIAGVAMLIGSISIRPSEKYLFEQIETARKQFARMRSMPSKIPPMRKTVLVSFGVLFPEVRKRPSKAAKLSPIE